MSLDIYSELIRMILCGVLFAKLIFLYRNYPICQYLVRLHSNKDLGF